ncbi:MAG TPA: serine protease [Nitrospiraceae bacterium]|nr:serine protease [Nitrospiraceae bacterium]
MNTMMSRAFLGCALVAVVLSTMSCAARTRYLTVRPPQALPTEGQPLPLTAALVLPEVVRNATDQELISCPFSTTSFVFQIGAGFEKGALLALSHAFTKVDVVKEKKLGQYDVFIEPAAPDIELQGHCNLFINERPTLDAKATVAVRITDRKDQPLLDAIFSSGQHTEEKVLDVVGKAMAELLQTMAQGLMSAPKMQTYAGIPPSAEPAEQKVAESTPRKTDAPAHAGPAKRVPALFPAVPAVSEPARPLITGAGFSVGFGYVVTAYHLVAGMSYATVYEHERALPAALVLRDRLSDVALLKVEEGDDTPALPGLRLGDGTKLKVGERVWISDLAPSTNGVEKVVWKEARLRPLPGNANGDPRILPLSLATPLQHSGGPVLNEQGEVIAMMLAPADAEHLFSNLGPLSPDTGIAIKIQYPKWLLSMLPESEFILPASMPRSVPISTLIENAKPQVVVIKAAAR